MTSMLRMLLLTCTCDLRRWFDVLQLLVVKLFVELIQVQVVLAKDLRCTTSKSIENMRVSMECTDLNFILASIKQTQMFGRSNTFSSSSSSPSSSPTPPSHHLPRATTSPDLSSSSKLSLKNLVGNPREKIR